MILNDKVFPVPGLIVLGFIAVELTTLYELLLLFWGINDNLSLSVPLIEALYA